MKRCFLLIVLIASHLISFSQVNRYIKQAGRATENGNLEKARKLYLKAIAKDPKSFKANAGLGVTLSEFIDQPEQALPYLETAYKNISGDTLPDLVYALAKCYHHLSRYEEALRYYNSLGDVTASLEDNTNFQLELKKRKEDCRYGIAHKNEFPDKELYVVNVGKKINTSMPEYVPVITPNNELIFTSKRKDTKHEKLNYLDGKYFESMYISKIEDSRFSGPRRYTVPDMFLKSKFRKHSESIISMSPDGKKLFIYRDAKIFEIDMDKVSNAEPKKLAKTINFDYYQNHAYLSRDGKTLLFTSEAGDAVGGIDIYRAEKVGEGVWSKPENIGKPVNTIYDEDAPFLSDDGQTLYFASKGHPGYGNFDIYRSKLVNGKWSEPENLGQPVNSPAHDIFMVLDPEGRYGYFSSARTGGQGDMDIYKINYLSKFSKECSGNDNLLSLSATNAADGKQIKATLPGNFKVYSYAWKADNSTVADAKSETLNYKPGAAGGVVQAKVIAWCDTCLEPYLACNSITVSAAGPDAATPAVTVTKANDLKDHHGQLTNEQLRSLGFDLQPLHFTFNKTELSQEDEKIILINIEVLKSHPELSVDISGYADSKGEESYNKKLSEKRAENVKAILIRNGVAKTQIRQVTGKGEIGNPANVAEDEANRKVEFTVYKD